MCHALLSNCMIMPSRNNHHTSHLKLFPLGQRTYPLVAGSVGPYGACQSDASEYHGDYVDSMSLEVASACTVTMQDLFL